MLLIRAISKLGSFSVEKISEPVRSELFKRSLQLIEHCEFVDIFLQCFVEAITNHPEVLSGTICQFVAFNFARIREEDIERSMKGTNEKYSIDQRATMETVVQAYESSAG
jgi:hypothetical protein